MAFIQFADQDKARATMAMMENNVSFTCYRGGIYELPEWALEHLTNAGYCFEHVDPPQDMSPNGSRVTVQTVRGYPPYPRL